MPPVFMFFLNSGASPCGVGLFVVPFLRYATERLRRHYYPLRGFCQLTAIIYKTVSFAMPANTFAAVPVIRTSRFWTDTFFYIWTVHSYLSINSTQFCFMYSQRFRYLLINRQPVPPIQNATSELRMDIYRGQLRSRTFPSL